MRFSSQNLVFADAVNYTTKMKLSSFANVYLNGQMDISKGVFPHSYYSSIESIRDAKEFPPYSSFKSCLGLPSEKDKLKYQSEYNSLSETEKALIDDNDLFMSPNIYISSLKEYNHKIELGEWHDMSCYLAFYNNRDVQVLALGYKNYIQACLNTYELSPLQCISLAHMASKLSWKYYCPMSYSIFSFSDKFSHLNQD